MSRKSELEAQLEVVYRTTFESQCPIEADAFIGIKLDLQRQYHALTGRYFHYKPRNRPIEYETREEEDG